jgi:hypothetical protein
MDTISKYNPHIRCADCKIFGVQYEHWGPMVPPNQKLCLCQICMMSRELFYRIYNRAKVTGIYQLATCVNALLEHGSTSEEVCKNLGLTVIELQDLRIFHQGLMEGAIPFLEAGLLSPENAHELAINHLHKQEEFLTIAIINPEWGSNAIRQRCGMDFNPTLRRMLEKVNKL